MTFADWVDESRQRFETQPLPRAAWRSTRELYRGAKVRLLWTYLQMADNTLETRLAGVDATFVVESRTDLERARSGVREERVMEWLLEAVDEDSVFWDVGGYHGHYSVLAGQCGADVIAFEPADVNRQRLERHGRLNDLDIDIREYALSDSDQLKRFGGSCASELGVSDGTGGWLVSTRRGDAIDERPDVVKVDVEGHEVAVLDGLEATLPGVRRIAIEVHDDGDIGGVERRLRDAGLTVCEIPTARQQTYLGGVR